MPSSNSSNITASKGTTAKQLPSAEKKNIRPTAATASLTELLREFMKNTNRLIRKDENFIDQAAEALSMRLPFPNRKNYLIDKHQFCMDNMNKLRKFLRERSRSKFFLYKPGRRAKLIKRSTYVTINVLH